MQHPTMLATSKGQWVLPGTPEFFVALGDSDPDYDSLLFAVKEPRLREMGGSRSIARADRIASSECRVACITRGSAADIVVRVQAF